MSTDWWVDGAGTGEGPTNRKKVQVSITLDGEDITDEVVFNDCFFEAHAFAQPGQFGMTIVPKAPTGGGGDEAGGNAGHHPGEGEEEGQQQNLPTLDSKYRPGKTVRLYIDGEAAYLGKVLTTEWTNFFPAGDGQGGGTKVILSGTDFNIYFDKIFVYDKQWKPGIIEDGKLEVQMFAPETMDKLIIETYLGRYLDVASVEEIWYDDTTIQEISTPIGTQYAGFQEEFYGGDGLSLATQSGLDASAGGTSAEPESVSGYDAGLTAAQETPPGLIAGPGASWRAVMEEVANNLYSKLPGGGTSIDAGYRQAAYWYIGPDGGFYYRPLETYDAPFAVGWEDEGDNIVGIREFQMVEDISSIRTEVMVYGLLMTPVKWTKKSAADIGLSSQEFGKWQAAEQLYDSLSIAAVEAHADQMLRQYGNSTKTAHFALYRPGLAPGMVIHIAMEGWRGDEKVPIRSMRMTFPTPWHVRYDVECVIETTAPWRYWYALQREPRRGMQQPPYTNVLDETELQDAEKLLVRSGTQVTGGRFVLLRSGSTDVAAALKKGMFQTRFAYKKNSLHLYLNGKRLSSKLDYTEGDEKTKYWQMGRIKILSHITKKLKRTDRLDCSYDAYGMLPQGVTYEGGDGLWPEES